MDIAIISGGSIPLYYDLLDKKLNQLIEQSGCFLFNILCGGIKGQERKEKSLGELWAKNNGAPVVYIFENTESKLVNQIFLKANYIIFILDGNPYINNLFMKYKMLGKHGTVIKVGNN